MKERNDNMKLVKTKRPTLIPALKTENRRILEEFISSDCECCEVVDYTQKTATIATGSLNQSIKTYRFSGIRAITKDNRVYLIRLI